MLDTDFMLDVASGYSFEEFGQKGHAKAARVYKARVASLTFERTELRDRV